MVSAALTAIEEPSCTLEKRSPEPLVPESAKPTVVTVPPVEPIVIVLPIEDTAARDAPEPVELVTPRLTVAASTLLVPVISVRKPAKFLSFTVGEVAFVPTATK